MFVVVVTEKGGSQQRIELDTDTVSIGRVHGNDIVLPRGNVSKKHASIVYNEEVYTLTDLGSTNGTFINGRRVRGSQVVNPGDKIYVGDFILHIELMASPITRSSVPDKGASAPPQPKPAASEKVERAPAPPPTIRASIPPPSAKSVDRPSEKRVRVPKLATPPPPARISEPSVNLSARPSMPSAPPPPPPPPPISPKRPERGKESSGITVKQILADAAIQLGVSEISDGPVAMVPEKVTKLRRVIKSLVEDAAADGALSPSQNADKFKGEVLRRAVDFGPIGEWLSDPDILEIHVFGTRTVSLRRAGGWSDIDSPFETVEALFDIAARLEAGLKRRGHRCDLEEGFALFRSGTPRLTLIINKNWRFLPSPHQEELFVGEDRRMVLEAIASNAKIAVVGREPAARAAVLSEVTRLIPKSAFITAVGHTVGPIVDCPKSILIRPEQMTGEEDRFAAAVEEGCAASPDWLVVSGFSWRHIPTVLAAANSRPAVIAELPVGAVERINRELSVSLVSAGISTTSSQAALHLNQSFDKIIVAGVSSNGIPCVQTILACSLSEKGTWAPKTLYERNAEDNEN